LSFMVAPEKAGLGRLFALPITAVTDERPMNPNTWKDRIGQRTAFQ
jgi:hypothetical protein